MGSKFPNPWCRRGTALLLVFLFIIFSPLIFSIALNLWVIRWFLSLLKKHFKPQLGDFLTSISSLLAIDSAYGNTTCSMTMFVSIKGHLSLPEIRRAVQNAMATFQAEDTVRGNGGKPKFQKLTQFLTTWMTFSVWEDETNFQIEDHVTLFDQEDLNSRFEKNLKNYAKTATMGGLGVQAQRLENFEVLSTDEEIVRLAASLIRIPYKRAKSPWEILVHHGVQLDDDTSGGAPSTILFCRFHHALADGLSGVLVLSHFVDDKDVFEKTIGTFAHTDENGRPLLTRWQSFFKSCRHLCGIYGYICNFLETWDGIPWNPDSFGTVRFDYHYLTAHVPMETIRKIMKEQGRVNFASVIVAILTSTIRRYFRGHGVMVPNDMHTVVTVGEPMDPMTTGNNFNCISIKMPTGLNHRDQIIQTVERDYLTRKSADSTGFLLLLARFLGQFPKFLMPGGSNTCSCITTTVPGFEKPTTIAGLPIISIRGVGYAPSANAVGVFTAVSHDDVDVVMCVSKHIMPAKEDAEIFQRYFQSEFVAYQKKGDVHNIICPEIPQV